MYVIIDMKNICLASGFNIPVKKRYGTQLINVINVKGDNNMKCVICNETITADLFGWEGGCNAEPVAEGQCCHYCDNSVVLPARIAQYGIKMKGEA